MRCTYAFLPLLLFYAAALNAQTADDRQLIEQARSLYSPNALPAYIACEATVDWDAAVEQLGLPQGEDTQRGLELLKGMKIAFVTRGESKTEVTVTGDERLAGQKKKIRQQITAFFHAYWTESDGRFFPGVDDAYQIASTPEGYLITRHMKNGIVGTLQMDTSFLITSARAVGSMSNLVLTPKFARESDGVLHIREMLIDYRFGESRSVASYSFDYQDEGGFYIPHHVKMSIPGALSFSHTFKNCRVLDKDNAPASPTPDHTTG